METLSLCTFMHTHGGMHTLLLCVDMQQNRCDMVGNVTSEDAGEPQLVAHTGKTPVPPLLFVSGKR